jgi:hypothetical protein
MHSSSVVRCKPRRATAPCGADRTSSAARAHIAGATAPPGSASAYSFSENTKANPPKTNQPMVKIHGEHLANHRLLS